MAELASSSLVSDPNLQGYWKLESGGTDSGPNGYNLTFANASTYVTGKFGNGIDLEGSSTQYLYIEDANCANLRITGSRTVTAWVKLESINESSNMAAVSKMHESDSYRGYTLGIQAGTGKPIFQVIGGLSGTSQVVSSSAVSVDSWYFIVGRYNSTTEKLSVFLNGVETNVTASGSSIDSGDKFSIGCTYAGAGNTPANYFDGMIDDAAIFNRALLDSEINELYTGVSTSPSLSPSLSPSISPSISSSASPSASLSPSLSPSLSLSISPSISPSPSPLSTDVYFDSPNVTVTFLDPHSIPTITIEG